MSYRASDRARRLVQRRHLFENSGDRPVLRDEQHVERDARVPHPERLNLLGLPRKQHAVVLAACWSDTSVPRERWASVRARSTRTRGAPGASTKITVARGSSGVPPGSGGQRAAGSARGGGFSGVGTTQLAALGAVAWAAADRVGADRRVGRRGFGRRSRAGAWLARVATAAAPRSVRRRRRERRSPRLSPSRAWRKLS